MKAQGALRLTTTLIINLLRREEGLAVRKAVIEAGRLRLRARSS